MTQYILDTDICISCLREQHGIAEKIDKIGTRNCCISQITLAELRYGAECSDFSDRRHSEIDEFRKYISVILMNDAIIDIYATQKAELRKRGLLIADFDLLIGATAICHGLVLVTNNTKHFERMKSIPLANWLH